MNTNRKYTCAAVPLLPGALLAFATAASAQDGLPPIEYTFPNQGTLTFYGQLNKGVLNYDDGIDTESYGLIDNDNSNTRVGLKYLQAFGAWTFENVNEIGYAPYSSANANILNTSPSDADYEFTNANIRKLDFTLANDRVRQVLARPGQHGHRRHPGDRPLRHRRHRLFERRRIRPAARSSASRIPT